MKKVHITKDNIEELIAKQSDGLANENEIKALEEWKSSSDENNKLYQDILKTNAFYAQMSTHAIDIDKAWGKVNEKMQSSSSKTQREIEEQFAMKKILKFAGYAASIIVLIMVGILIKTPNPPSQIATADSTLSHELEDGSVILLGKNTALSKLDENERTYSFTGEAEFQIVHNEEKPFLVQMNDIMVKDLGTVFRIESIPLNDTIFVSVTEGKAQFYTLSDSGIILEGGEEGMYIKSKNRFYKRSIDIKNQVLSISFENVTLEELIDHLSYSFRKTISINNEALKNCNLTVEFSKAPLSIVKEIIEETLNVDITHNQSSLSIDGKGCK